MQKTSVNDYEDDDVMPWDDVPRAQAADEGGTLEERKWSFAKLPDGKWGASTYVKPIEDDGERDDYSPKPGEKIVITKRDGVLRNGVVNAVADVKYYESGGRSIKVSLR